MSTIPAVLDALVAAVRAVMPDVQVCDGQPAEDLADEVVVVGWQMERAAVSVDWHRQDAGGMVDREIYDVAGLISVVTGDTTTKPVRDRAFELWDLLAAELRRDPTLGVAGVMRARPFVAAFDQVQTSGDDVSAGGASATISWVVLVDAFDGG
jgi:hypothetical protein